MDVESRVREAIRLHGGNSNSFLSLYKGFRYLELESGAIAYADTRKAWVGAAEPLVEKARMEAALKGFAEKAAATGKVAMAFPVSDDVARLARTLGYEAVKIGSEPIFDFSTYKPDIDLVHTAKRLHVRGAVVREFRPEELSGAEKYELEQITEEWLQSRKMVTLSFLNTVDPWALSKDKRYFSISLRGELLAFVAAVPVWKRNGWYLIDLLRRHVTPAGSTELLILEAMRILRDSGAKDVTLGVAPLADLRPFPDPDHPMTYRVLDLGGAIFSTTFSRFTSSSSSLIRRARSPHI
jgi:phosphatidylglycerol lysyltransferase